MKKFSVTYEIVTPESAEDGDVAERGFVCQDVGLRDALAEFDHDRGYVEPSCLPVDWSYPHLWLTKHEFGRDYTTGAEESRSFHMPETLTSSSRRRIARLAGYTA